MPMNTPGRYPYQSAIDAYGNGGFRFADMSHKGSILCLPGGMIAWEPAEGEPAGDPLLQALRAEAPLPGSLILGTGARLVLPGPSLRRSLLDLGVTLEAMDTGAAVRTYNIMFGEGRDVGAALVAVG